MSDELDSFGDSIFNGYLPSLWRKLCPDTQKPLGTILHYIVVHSDVNPHIHAHTCILTNTNTQIRTNLNPPSHHTGSWVSHFIKRYEQYENLILKGDPACLWISGLHIPESYLTALVQSTCRVRGWPLDKSTFYTVVTKHYNDQDVSKLESGMNDC
jgi:dynein heavy chain, axonemal